MDDLSILNYINNYDVVNANQTTATPENTSSPVSFAETLDLAKRTLTAMSVDAALVSLKSKGETGINLDSKLAYDLGLVSKWVNNFEQTQGAGANALNPSLTDTTPQSQYIRSIDINNLPIDVSQYKTNKCPTHTGSSGYDNTGVLKCSDELQECFEVASAVTGVDVKLIKAVSFRESSFRENTKYTAKGYMALMPSACDSYGVKDVLDPLQNILGGAAILANFLNRYDGDLSLTLAAYNAGPGTVQKNGGVPPRCNKYINDIIGFYNS